MKRAFTLLATVLALGVLATASMGCAPAQHQVIGAGQECGACHSEEKPVYEQPAEAPSGVLESGPRVDVETDAASVVVCRPVFTAEDGSAFVPQKESEAPVTDGRASVELRDGLWALCVDEGDAARAELVRVDSSSASTAVVKL